MSRFGFGKWLVAVGWAMAGLLLLVPFSLSKTDFLYKAEARSDDYVGSDACSACHEDQFKSFSKTTHSRLTQAHWKPNTVGCESCHGPGKAHVESDGDKTKIRTFKGETAKQISDNCLTCHAGREEHNNFRRGEHWRNDVGCIDCHAPHISEKAQAEWNNDGSSSLIAIGPFAAKANNFATRHLLKRHEVQLCMECHNETKAQFTMPFHHKVLEGAINCSDCHNPHGGFEQKQARLASGADAGCVKCHADKQGPFVFEHAPLKVEGCSACHDPHGSANPKLLKRSTVSQLCIECHSNIGALSGEEESGATQVPHTLTERFQNCTICHVMIHGSNTNKRFFR